MCSSVVVSDQATVFATLLLNMSIGQISDEDCREDQRCRVHFQDLTDRSVVHTDDGIVPGYPVACSEITPKPEEWWLRPVINAARVGEQSAVE